MAVLRCGRARFARGDRSEAAAVVPLDMPGFLRIGKNFFPRKPYVRGCICLSGFGGHFVQYLIIKLGAYMASRLFGGAFSVAPFWPAPFRACPIVPRLHLHISCLLFVFALRSILDFKICYRQKNER
ncbi:unnamed protein product [Meloidogyne enterolobii]|uniref:Uncharacterized protein n=1 Tax=Meloidogyne enterolobii TaxID=390850 RepID=A0ACB0YIS2_MELEN